MQTRRPGASSARTWWLPWVATLSLLALAAARTAEADGGARLTGPLQLVSRGMLAPSVLGGSGARLTVSVRVAGGAPSLIARGYAASPASGMTAFVDVAPAELASLRAEPGVISVEHTRLLHTTLDRSVALSGVPEGRVQPGLAVGLDGRGVLIGIVDTGVDFRHADFRAADGSTRIAALLDFASRRGALHPEIPAYSSDGAGAVSLAADIDAQLAADDNGQPLAAPILERDTDGHGTHVAGIAASSGLATGKGLPAGRYVGMAPAASLIVAKATRGGGGFSESDLLSSVRFVFDRATALGLPAVVNLSLGGDGGPHDGTTNLERALSDLAPADAKGRALVVSAGNAGSRDHHAGGFSLAAIDAGPVSLRVPFPANADASSSISMELWFDGPPPSITLISPTGKPYGPVAAGATLDTGLREAAGHVLIASATLGRDPLNQRYEASLYVTSTTRPVAGGDWTVVLDGQHRVAEVGRWDAWLTQIDVGADAPRFLDHLDEDNRCDYPAYATSAIAVGSFVSRSSWRTVDGRTIVRGTVAGRPSSFSGTGPSIDGRFLPDLSAPGDFIASALSSDAPATSAASVFYIQTDPAYLVADDGVHGLLRGTSQAAPHVTGAIALLFQIDPTLTTSRLRELLRASATVDPGAPGYSVRLGFGRLHVGRAASLLLGRPVGAVDAAVSSVGASRWAMPPGETRAMVSVVPRDATGAPLGAGHAVTIEADAGAWDGPVRDLGGGRYERALVAHGARGTAAHLHVTVDGVALEAAPAVWFVRDPSEVGRPFAATGGCGVAGASGPPASWSRAALAPPMTMLAALLVAGALHRRAARRRARA